MRNLRFSGAPLMSQNSLASTAGPLSISFSDLLKARPMRSSEIESAFSRCPQILIIDVTSPFKNLLHSLLCLSLCHGCLHHWFHANPQQRRIPCKHEVLAVPTCFTVELTAAPGTWNVLSGDKSLRHVFGGSVWPW